MSKKKNISIRDAISETIEKGTESLGDAVRKTDPKPPMLPEIPTSDVAEMQGLMEKYGDQPPESEPQKRTPSQEIPEVLTMSEQEATILEPLKTSVFSTIPLPPTFDSILELPASPLFPAMPTSLTPQTPSKVKEQKPLLDFIESNSFSPNWTRQQLLKFDSGENLWPSPNIWHLPPQTDLGKMMFDVVRSPDYVQKNWPALRVVMGNCIDNTEWTCGVLCFFALCSVLGILGRVQEAFDDMEAGRV